MTFFHPDSQWLSEYIAGTLTDSHALCVATHLSYCSTCRNETAELMMVGAALFESLVDNSSSPEKLEQLLTDIQTHLTAVPATGTNHRADASPLQELLPPAVNKLVPNGTNGLRWRKTGGKISIAKLNHLGDGRKISLHKLQPGSLVSNHDHGGCEITVVLCGSFSDDDGQYHAGDFLVREPGETHRPKANTSVECICLTVCEGPVKLTGQFGRILNPLLAFQYKHW